MRQIPLFFIVVVAGVLNYNFLHAQTWLWAKGAGRAQDDKANAIARDSRGNIYVAGYFASDTIGFGGRPLTNPMDSSAVKQMFLVKLDSSGHVIWQKTVTSDSSQTIATCVGVDSSGNIYVGGIMDSGQVVFNSDTLTGYGGSDIFLVKYDSGGHQLWARQAGGALSDKANALSVDATGNVYLAGSFASPFIWFDTVTVANGGSGTGDAFIVKYDALGGVVWVRTISGTQNDNIKSIVADGAGNIYVTGDFLSNILSFGGSSIANASATVSTDVFLAKYDAAGIFHWAKAATVNMTADAYSVAVDAANNIYISGNFYGTTINFGSLFVTSPFANTMYLAKFDPGGNAIWATGSKGGNGDAGGYIATDGHSNVIVAGHFKGTNIGFGRDTLSYAGAEDIFVASFDSSGKVQWATSAGGSANDYATAVTADGAGNVYIAGYLDGGAIAFDTCNVADSGGNDILIARYAPPVITVGVSQLMDEGSFSVYPVPTTGVIEIRSRQPFGRYEIYNSIGQRLVCADVPQAINTTLDLSALPDGTYFLVATGVSPASVPIVVHH